METDDRRGLHRLLDGEDSLVSCKRSLSPITLLNSRQWWSSKCRAASNLSRTSIGCTWKWTTKSYKIGPDDYKEDSYKWRLPSTGHASTVSSILSACREGKPQVNTCEGSFQCYQPINRMEGTSSCTAGLKVQNRKRWPTENYRGRWPIEKEKWKRWKFWKPMTHLHSPYASWWSLDHHRQHKSRSHQAIMTEST